jgi:hypothetical protein
MLFLTAQVEQLCRHRPAIAVTDAKQNATGVFRAVAPVRVRRGPTSLATESY